MNFDPFYLSLYICRSYEGHGSPVNALSFCPGDDFMVSGSSNGDFCVWSVQYNHTKALCFYYNAHDLGVNALHFSHASKVHTL